MELLRQEIEATAKAVAIDLRLPYELEALQVAAKDGAADVLARDS
jgi:hypothetical protein